MHQFITIFLINQQKFGRKLKPKFQLPKQTLFVNGMHKINFNFALKT